MKKNLGCAEVVLLSNVREQPSVTLHDTRKVRTVPPRLLGLNST